MKTRLISAALAFAVIITVYTANLSESMYFAEIAAVGATPNDIASSQMMQSQLVAFDLR